MSHRATISISRLSQSFCMRTHPGTISKQDFTSPKYFFTHRMPNTVLSGMRVLQANFQILSVRTQELAATQKWLGKHSSKCYPFVKVKHEVGRKEGPAGMHLASVCAFFAVFSGRAQGQDEPSHKASMSPRQPREEKGSYFTSSSYLNLLSLSPRETM